MFDFRNSNATLNYLNNFIIYSEVWRPWTGSPLKTWPKNDPPDGQISGIAASSAIGGETLRKVVALNYGSTELVLCRFVGFLSEKSRVVRDTQKIREQCPKPLS
jgi:hypothetical protein